ncbi:MAG: hypothetical protein M3Q10_12180 [Chloroflexota bacterium]|nr:hypothetical protein [Chloroflexota bacterium]
MHLLLGLVLVSVLGMGGFGQGMPPSQPPPAPPNAQSDEEAAAQAQARARAEELFGLAAAGNFNALFDRIHPDAQAVIPRTAGIRAFEQVYALARPGEAEIVNVALGSWT